MSATATVLGGLWLPILFAAAGGAAVAWAWSRWRRLDRSAAVYLKGLRYLLSGDPDGAIAMLTKVAPSGTPEAYFTLGTLFRRKGELERAIQLHRNLLLSGLLDGERRREALLELGRDYREARLWDEAAKTLEAALEEEPRGSGDQALGAELRDVYLAQGRFEEAARQQRALAAPGADPLGAHLWAEAARLRLGEGQVDLGERAAVEALAADAGSAHAHWARAAVRIARGDLAGARVEALEAVRTAPEAAGLVFPWLVPLHEGREARAALLAEIDRWLEGRALPDDPLPDARLARAQLLRAAGRQEEAVAELRALLGCAPGFLEARQELGRLLLEGGVEGELRAEYERLLHALGADTALGRCRQCGQPAREVSWRCPACGAWDWLDSRPREARVG